MRLLFFSEVYTPWQGGAIVAIRNLMTQLTAHGHEVTMVTGERRNRWRLLGVRTEFDEACSAKVYRIPAIPNFVGIKKIIKNENPDIIHIFSPIGIAEKITLHYAKQFHLPIVVTNHI